MLFGLPSGSGRGQRACVQPPVSCVDYLCILHISTCLYGLYGSALRRLLSCCWDLHHHHHRRRRRIKTAARHSPAFYQLLRRESLLWGHVCADCACSPSACIASPWLLCPKTCGPGLLEMLRLSRVCLRACICTLQKAGDLFRCLVYWLSVGPTVTR